jgi:dsDNA-specific endonuclease/ATPase MutS2
MKPIKLKKIIPKLKEKQMMLEQLDHKKKKDQPKTRPKTITYNQKLKNEINIMMEQYEVQLKEVENRCKRLFDKEYSSVTCDGGGQLAFDIDTTKSKFISFY